MVLDVVQVQVWIVIVRVPKVDYEERHREAHRVGKYEEVAQDDSGHGATDLNREVDRMKDEVRCDRGLHTRVMHDVKMRKRWAEVQQAVANRERRLREDEVKEDDDERERVPRREVSLAPAAGKHILHASNEQRGQDALREDREVHVSAAVTVRGERLEVRFVLRGPQHLQSLCVCRRGL